MAKIVCEWAEDNKVYVDENGNVYPCCYWHHEIRTRRVEIQPEFIINYSKQVDNGKWNLKDQSLIEITNSDFYQRELKEHIEGDTPNKVCKWQCGYEEYQTTK